MKKNGFVSLVVVLFLASVVPLVGGTAQTSFRAPTWVYEFFTLDAPGAFKTILSGINNRNEIVGWTLAEVGYAQGFRLSNGVFTPVAVPSANGTSPDDLNDSGAIVGACSCPTLSGGPTHGFLYAGGTYYIAPYEDPIGVTMGFATGVNNPGNIVGWYHQEARAPDGGVQFFRFGYFDSQKFSRVIMGGVNDAGHAVGIGPITGEFSGAFLQAGATTTRITLPFTTDVPEPSDVNNADTVVGSYLHENAPDVHDFRGFVWSNGKAVRINYPGARSTWVKGINDAGIIVGYYQGDSFALHGFLAVPRSPVTVTVNGGAGAMTIDRTQPLRVDVAFAAPPEGPLNPAELYVGVVTPYGVFWSDASGRFVTTATRVFAGALTSFGPSPAINLSSASSLPAGTYTWFAIVDDDTNATPNATFYDLAQVTIR